MSGFNIARPFHPRLHESFGILRREGKKFPHLSGVQTLGDCSLRRRELILSKGRVSGVAKKMYGMIPEKGISIKSPQSNLDYGVTLYVPQLL